MQKTKLIVGLGNVGKKYTGTRHNIGFAALDQFAEANEFPVWTVKKDLRCELTINTIANTRLILIKPTTYMNLSGEAVQAVQRFYKVGNFDTIVVHDELALPFGQIRLRAGGSDAGNNGIKSLIISIGEDFGRIRIGIGNEATEQTDASDFVLAKFSKDEAAHLKDLFKETNALINEAVVAPDFPSDTRSFI